MRISDWSSDVCSSDLEKRIDPVTGEILRAWFETDVLQAFADRIIAVATEVAMRCAALHVPDPPSERDGLLAATALVHSMTFITLNIIDFEKPCVDFHNPCILEVLSALRSTTCHWSIRVKDSE